MHAGDGHPVLPPVVSLFVLSYCVDVLSRRVGTYDSIWDAFLEHHITHYAGAPTVHLSITSHAKARKLDRPVIVSVAGAPPTPTLISSLEKINIQVAHVYGLTETVSVSTNTIEVLTMVYINSMEYVAK